MAEKEEGSLFSDGIMYSWSLLSPLIYETYKRGEVPTRDWADGWGKYAPSLQTDFYQLSFSFLADRLLEEAVRKTLEDFAYDQLSYMPLLDSPFERAILIKSREFQILLAKENRRVIRLSY